MEKAHTNVHANVKALVDGLYNTPEHVDNAGPAKPQKSSGDEPQVRRPTIPGYLHSIKNSAQGTDPQPAYSEMGVGLNKAADPMTQFKGQFASLKDKTPADRARIGGQFGAKVGASVAGLHGAVLGAAVGAVATRSLGLVQSGEHEDNLRKEKILNTLKTVGIADDKNNIKFSDGSKFSVNNDPSFRLKNVDPTVTGTRDRGNTEVDSSHPMTKRATAAALPLAYYTTHGLLSWGDQNNPRDKAAIKNTTGLIVNALQNGAKNINQVYARAREWADKYGTEDTMRSFFNSIKDKVPEADASMIRQGLDATYAAK
jgi:hypothetical protein